MNAIISKFSVLGTIVLFSVSVFSLPSVLASPKGPTNIDVEITIKVNQDGFMDHRNRPMGPKNPLKIPKGKVVRITFQFSEKMTSLAYGDTHQFTVASKDGWEQETGKIWILDQDTSVTFLAGDNGRTTYRAYCILDCIGMKHLKNLVIVVV